MDGCAITVRQEGLAYEPVYCEGHKPQPRDQLSAVIEALNVAAKELARRELELAQALARFQDAADKLREEVAR